MLGEIGALATSRQKVKQPSDIGLTSPPAGLGRELTGGMGAAPAWPLGDPGPADGLPFPVPCRTCSLSTLLSSHPRSSPSQRHSLSAPHLGCAAAGTASPSISTSASSAAMMGPKPIRAPERSRERWKDWGWGLVRHGAELKPRPAPSAQGGEASRKTGVIAVCVLVLRLCEGLGKQLRPGL